MLKNYIIGLLCGYILVGIPFWQFDRAAQPVLVALIAGTWIAWLIRIAEDDIRYIRKRKMPHERQLRGGK